MGSSSINIFVVEFMGSSIVGLTVVAYAYDPQLERLRHWAT